MATTAQPSTDLPSNLPVEKFQRRARVLDRPERILVRLSHVPKKAADFRVRQFAWMPLAVKHAPGMSVVPEVKVK